MPQFIGMIVDQLDVETGIPFSTLHYLVAMGYFGLSIISYLFYYVQDCSEIWSKRSFTISAWKF